MKKNSRQLTVGKEEQLPTVNFFLRAPARLLANWGLEFG